MIEVSGTDAPMTWNERQEAIGKLSEGKDSTKKEAV
jgi:dihydropyrimidine dehydrogenase (NAD+) subunit PreA